MTKGALAAFMNILIDLLLLLIVALVIAAVARKSAVRAVVTFAALVVGAVSMLLAPYAAPYAKPLFAPVVQNSAAAELADLAGTPVFDSAEETLSKIDLTVLQQQYPEDFAEIIGGYGVLQTELTAAIDKGPAAVSTVLGNPMSCALALVSCKLAVALVCMLLVLGVSTAILRRKPKVRHKGTTVTVLLGVLSSIVVVAFWFLPLMESFRPFSTGVLRTIQWDAACEHSVLYRIFDWLHSLIG